MCVDVVVIVMSNKNVDSSKRPKKGRGKGKRNRKSIKFGGGNLKYMHTGFMQTLRDRKDGIYIPDTDRASVVKINSSFRDVALDLKDVLGYSASAIVDAAFKVGIRRIEYYCPIDIDGGVELYKLAKKVNIALSKTYKDRMEFTGNPNAHYIFDYSRAQLSIVKNKYITDMDSMLRLDNTRSTVRYINDDTVSGYNSYFRHIGITQQGLLHLAFMAGVSNDYNSSEKDWKNVSGLIPSNYNNIVIAFANNAYNAYLNLMNDDIFKKYNE